jgi:linoleate 10R-lipoxygenase
VIKCFDIVWAKTWIPKLGLETKKPCDEFLARLAASGKPIDELVATVLGLAIGSGVNYAQGMSSL